MEPSRFDALARAVTGRRSALGLLAALGLGLGVPDGAAAAACKAVGKPCARAVECCSGLCQGQPGRKRCRCRDGRRPCRGRCCGRLQRCTARGRCVPCPRGTTPCGGTCVDITRNPRHCGRCNAVCPAGTTCLHGGCFTTTCQTPSPPGNCSGASCAGPTCAAGENCGFCDVTTEAQTTCVNLSPPCSELPGCAESADCPLGEVCVTNGCCAFQGKPNICVRPV